MEEFEKEKDIDSLSDLLVSEYNSVISRPDIKKQLAKDEEEHLELVATLKKVLPEFYDSK
ncbi:hypothetical protein FACS1894188_07020 [Clostridia bacterium]|nr:hypothetical protein FACS1894188_07020 [Clostridia bacterium]